MDRRKQLVPAIQDANVARRNQEMSFSADASLGRRTGAGLFEPGNGIPPSKEIHGKWLNAGALHRITGIQGAGAIMTSDDAQMDPYKACIGIAAHARDFGARLFERSRVGRITPAGRGLHVKLARGEIRAAWAIIATGYATPEFKPLAGRFRMTNTYVIATPRLDGATRRRMGLGRVMLWDTEEPYHYARWTPDGRLILGGEDERRKHDRRRALARHARTLAEHLQSLYPILRGVQAEYAWERLFATTPDGLPYIGTHRNFLRHLFAVGLGRHGAAAPWLGARIILRHIAGDLAKGDGLFGFSRILQPH